MVYEIRRHLRASRLTLTQEQETAMKNLLVHMRLTQEDLPVKHQKLNERLENKAKEKREQNEKVQALIRKRERLSTFMPWLLKGDKSTSSIGQAQRWRS